MFYPNIASAAHVAHAPARLSSCIAGPSNCFKSHSANCFATHSACGQPYSLLVSRALPALSWTCHRALDQCDKSTKLLPPPSSELVKCGATMDKLDGYHPSRGPSNSDHQYHLMAGRRSWLFAFLVRERINIIRGDSLR